MSTKNKYKILIIDYGVGNFNSVANALDFLGYQYSVSNKAEDIAKNDVYILPGVGAFAEAMKNLGSLKMIEPLKKEVIENKKPIFGICLGMQVLANSSEENGFHDGLGFIEGRVLKFEENKNIKIPHVGWNTIQVKCKSPLFDNVSEKPMFYFDHSYYFKCDNKYVSSIANYGVDFIASVQKENIYGTQFHPEKSQNDGLRVFRSFFNYIEAL